MRKHAAGQTVKVHVSRFQPPWRGLPIKETMESARIVRQRESPPLRGFMGENTLNGYDIIWLEGPKKGQQEWVPWDKIAD